MKYSAEAISCRHSREGSCRYQYTQLEKENSGRDTSVQLVGDGMANWASVEGASANGPGEKESPRT